MGELRIECKNCVAECCKHIAIQIDAPEELEDFQQIADFLNHENVSVYQDVEGDWIVDFKSRCKNLNGPKCEIWGTEQYPLTCREYDVKTCVMNEPGEYWKILFDTPEQVADYCEKKALGMIQTRKPRNCREECCNHINVPIDEPEDTRDIDDIKWYLWHNDVVVMMDEDGDWFVELKAKRNFRCTKCDIQNCRDDDYEYPVVFFEPSDVEKYAKDKGIELPRIKKKMKLDSH